MDYQSYRLISFKVESSDNKFDMTQDYIKFHNIDWTHPSTETLYKQIVNEKTDFQNYEKCFLLSQEQNLHPSIEVYKDKLFKIVSVNGVEEIFILDLPYSKYECEKKYQNSVYSYTEIFSRDEDALNGYTNRNKSMKFDSDLYVIVLLKDNNYLGHIYSWISPKDSDYCFALGIRKSIHFLFDDSEKSISRILLDGVRQFAIKKGAKYINVDTPAWNMITILSHYGFVKYPIHSSFLGKNLSYDESKICVSNMSMRDLSIPLIKQNIDLILLENYIEV